MDKLKLVLIGSDSEKKTYLRTVLAASGLTVAGSYEAQNAEKAISQRPDAVVLLAGDGVFDLAARMYESLPGCPMLLAADDAGVDTMAKAMQAGMRGVFSQKDAPERMANEIRLAVSIERSRAKSAGRPLFTRGSVITIFSGKGGVGKTTAAVNIAAALAGMGKRVVVLDADLQFGDVALMLDMEPKDSIAELVQEQSGLDAETVKSFCMLHHTGVSVLCAPKSPECAEYITAHHIETILGSLRTAFDFIIVDTPPSFNDTTLAAIESSDRILLIAGVDISTLKNARACVGTFSTLQQREKLRVVINSEQPSMIKVKDVEKMLELPVFGRVKCDAKTALDCLNRGTPAVCAAPRSHLAKELSFIARKIAEDNA